MKTKPGAGRIRVPETPRDALEVSCVELALEYEERDPASEYLAMCQELAIPGLEEYLRDISDLDLCLARVLVH